MYKPAEYSWDEYCTDMQISDISDPRRVAFVILSDGNLYRVSRSNTSFIVEMALV